MSKTYGEQFESAMVCQTQDEATAWLAREIAEFEAEYGQTPERARHAIMTNLGYMAGYYDAATAEKVYQLFGAVHPIFGRTRPTAEEAFAAGRAMGAAAASRTEGRP